MKTTRAIILFFLFVILVMGCVYRVLYLDADSRVVHLRTNEPAPHDGWLLTDQAYYELYEAALETWARREVEDEPN